MPSTARFAPKDFTSPAVSMARSPGPLMVSSLPLVRLEVRPCGRVELIGARAMESTVLAPSWGFGRVEVVANADHPDQEADGRGAEAGSDAIGNDRKSVVEGRRV